MVLTTLTDVDVILGMDVLSQFGIRIDCKKQTASSAQEYCTSLILEENIKIPAGKSRVFLVSNTLPGLTLFEPGANLPEGLLGVPALGQGSKLAIQLDNLSERDIMLNPKWDTGQLYSGKVIKLHKAGDVSAVGSLQQCSSWRLVCPTVSSPWIPCTSCSSARTYGWHSAKKDTTAPP